MFRFLSVSALSVMLVFVATPAASYDLPTTGPVVDNWRPPVDQYGAGNRGVDFATIVGSDVVASEAGVVSFAGQVGDANYVVVEHSDGLRTTYGGLNAWLVTRGEVLTKGARLGIASSSLHFGVRRGETYLDPNLLFEFKAKLIPLEGRNLSQRVVFSVPDVKIIASGRGQSELTAVMRKVFARF